MKKFFKDFKTFITKGNIVDLAIAVVIGGAFGKIVTSMVNDIIMPLISLATGGVSVTDWKWVIKEAVVENGVVKVAESALRYGTFIQTILDFLIIAFFIFLALRILMIAKNKLEVAKNNVAELSKNQIKKLRKKGLSEQEIADMQNAPAAEPEKVEVVKQATTEDLLAEIRDLLKQQNENKPSK